MDWPATLDFIQRHDPAFVSGLQGVPAADLAALEADCGVTLPASYLEFMRLMGLSCQGFMPFGATQDPSFAAIAERLDEDDQGALVRFFPVAIETDESLEALYDHHLDLQRGDGDDAALVLLEQGVPLEWQTPVELSLTLGEHITASVFSQFALLRHAHQDTITLAGTGQAALTLLRHAGLSPVLSFTPRVACLQSQPPAAPLSALVQVQDVQESVTVRLGGDAVVAVMELADQLFAALPGARRPAGPRNLD